MLIVSPNPGKISLVIARAVKNTPRLSNAGGGGESHHISGKGVEKALAFLYAFD